MRTERAPSETVERADLPPARVRVETLLDAGSFVPIRSEVRSPHLPEGPPTDGAIVGAGRIAKRKVFVFSQDGRVLGGSLGEMHASSICRVLDLAARFRSPVIGIHQSGGARIQEGVGALAGYARVFSRHVNLRGVVPQIALVFGPCAGGAAYGPALMDFVVMPESGTYLFLTGPDVVRQVTGEEVSFDELGGAIVHGRSGLASLVGTDEPSTLALARDLLGFLPSNREQDPPMGTGRKGVETDPGQFVPADARKSYDIRKVIAAISDDDPFLEVKAKFAPNLCTGFARIDGRAVGIIANQPQALAGTIDVSASQKGAWFVSMCDRYRLPLVVLVDTPGFLPGKGQELSGVIPHGASFLSAFVSARVPKITVVLRKAYGGAYIVMNAKDLGADYAFAWPQAEIAVLGARGAVQILERKRLKAAEDPDSLRAELEEEYRARHCTPWPAAQAGYIDEVIEPAETRQRLILALAG